MKVLRERGLIITRQGRGTFVAPAARRDKPETGEGAPAEGDKPQPS
jgi:DNA-binding GntR family transcriptional regulator